MTKISSHGIIAGALASMLGCVYLYLYQDLLFLDFSVIINYSSLIGASMLGCLLMAGGYLLAFKINSPKLKGWLNVLYVLISFASIFGPLLVTLPLDIDFPELFPGLAIPLHFIPPLAFLSLTSFFEEK